MLEVVFVVSRYIILVIGAWTTLKLALNIYKWFEEIFLLKELDLQKRYGYGSWAAITGSTDGIGLGFARGLANRGFNIVLISRNPKKLQNRKEEIIAEAKRNGKTVEVKTVQIDFEEIHKPESIQKIDRELSGLDISILVNNVGISTGGVALIDMELSHSLSMVKINLISQTLMTKWFFSKIAKKARNGKSALIHISSITSLASMSAKEIYCGSKKFNQRFGLNLWHKSKNAGIDTLVFKPGYIQTNLTHNRKLDVVTCLVDEAVNSVLRVLGQRTETYGHWKHIRFGGVLSGVFWTIPYSVVTKGFKPVYKMIGWKTGIEKKDKLKED